MQMSSEFLEYPAWHRHMNMSFLETQTVLGSHAQGSEAHGSFGVDSSVVDIMKSDVVKTKSVVDSNSGRVGLGRKVGRVGRGGRVVRGGRVGIISSLIGTKYTLDIKVCFYETKFNPFISSILLSLQSTKTATTFHLI